MKEFKTKVWLPDQTEECGGYQACCFLLGDHRCVLLDKTLGQNSRGMPVKHEDCPAYKK